MSYTIILLSFFLGIQSSQADPPILKISAGAAVEVPADLIQMHINFNAKAESPRAVYKIHKERES